MLGRAGRFAERTGLEVKQIPIQDLPNADLGVHFETIVEYIHRSRGKSVHDFGNE